MTQFAQVQYRDYVDRYTFALKFPETTLTDTPLLSSFWTSNLAVAKQTP